MTHRFARVIGLMAMIGLTVTSIWAQTDAEGWTVFETGSQASLRGLSVVNHDVIWCSGSLGTVLKTTDGGKHWKQIGPPNSNDLDFRSIRAFDDRRALVASAGDRDLVFKTVDGGTTWNKVYEHPDSKAFLDAMVFWDEQHGAIMGDPLGDRLFLLMTDDGGKTWHELTTDQVPQIESGEAGFAASNSNICTLGDTGLAIALGGDQPGKTHSFSRVLLGDERGKSWSSVSIPMPRGESAGIFSIAQIERRMIAVGGNYRQESSPEGNIALSLDLGKTWYLPAGQVPRGFRSAVAATKFDERWLAVATGPAGTDVSFDFGENWNPLASTGFHAIAFTFDGSRIWASGSNGRIGVISTRACLNQE